MAKIIFDDAPKRWKYRLLADHKQSLPDSFSLIEVRHEFFRVDNCLLVVNTGYSWDGASGPTLDDGSNMRASLVHDVLYQAISEKLLDKSMRKEVDRLFYRMLREDGMPWWRAQYYYLGVRWFGWMHV